MLLLTRTDVRVLGGRVKTGHDDAFCLGGLEPDPQVFQAVEEH